MNKTKKNGVLNFDTYEYDKKQSLPERAAHALHWAAQHYPKQVVAYNHLLKAIMGFAQMPRLNNESVFQLRRKMNSIKKILHNIYGSGFYAVRNLGVRATVDSEDQLKTDLVGATRRFSSAAGGFQRAASLVNIKDVPNTPGNKAWIAWYNSSLKNQLSAIPTYLHMLKAPDETAEKKEEAQGK